MKLRHLFTYDFAPGKVYSIPDVPYSVLWDISYACNQRCRFCYNNEWDFQRRMPPASKTLEIARLLADWGIKEVIILGGEPTLNTHLKEIISVFSSKEVQIRLISNGVNISEEMATFFAEHDVETGISLHGINADNHNYLTQTPLSFEKAMAAIEHLSKANAKCYVQFTPTKLSNTLLESAAFFRQKFPNITCFDINRLMPHGVGAREADTIFLDSEGWWNCLKQIPMVRRMEINVSVESVPHCWIYEMGHKEGMSAEDIQSIIASIRPCYMGINQIALDDQGRFKLCPGGNAIGDSILETSPSSLWKNSEFLSSRRRLDFLPEKCLNFSTHSSCVHFYECGGGCKMTSTQCGTERCSADRLIRT